MEELALLYHSEQLFEEKFRHKEETKSCEANSKPLYQMRLGKLNLIENNCLKV